MRISKSLTRYRQIVFLTVSLLVLLSVCLSANAQSVHGAILGTVKDASGAVVPGATVILTNTDEGAVRTTVSNSVGDYQFLDSKPDHYRVEVQASGFEKWAANGLQLSSLQQLRVDAKLIVGSVAAIVNVSGSNAGTIETETPTITSTYNADDVMNLPTNFRASTGGTTVIGAMGSMSGVQADQGAYAIQGNMPFTTDVTVDGITNIEVGSSGTPLVTPTADAISEIRLTGVLANAEFGDPAQLNITSKAGTNQLHGAGWWYHQDSGLNAINFGSTTKPHVVANSYGARIGGPVVIPWLYNGHNKTFFFGDYEGYQLPESATYAYTVPTAAMKNGDFSSYSNPSSGYKGLTDPYSGQSWGNQVPSSSISSIAKAFMAFYPDPNTVATLSGGGTVPTSQFVVGESPNYYVNQSVASSSNHVDVRGDQYFGSDQRFLLWGRYSYLNAPSVSPYPLNFPASNQINKQQNFVVSLSWTITHNIINVFTGGYNLWDDGKADSFDGTTWTKNLGLQGLQDLWYNGIPALEFNTYTNPVGGRLNSLDKQSTTTYADNLTWTFGNHSLKFGFDERRYLYDAGTGLSTGDQYGNFAFSNQGNAIGDFTGVEFGDFLTGIPDNSFYDVIAQDVNAVAAEYHVYAQDSWKATQRLTVDYGVRYEYRPGFYDKNGYIANFDPSVPLSGRIIYPDGAASLLAQTTLASANACDEDGVNNTNSAVVNGAPCMPVIDNTAAGLPKGLRTSDKLRFLPRIGFAYRLTNDNKWVVRGGWGMYNVSILGQTFHALTATIQGNGAQYTNTLNAATHQPDFAWPEIYSGSGSGGCTTCYGQDEFNAGIDIHYHDPITSQWALSVDHDLGAGYGIRASYIGSESYHMNWEQDLNTLPISSAVSAYNQPFSARRFPNWGVLENYTSTGNANYNSLQVEATHRMQHGLQYTSTFTWAKSLSDLGGPSSQSFGGERGGGMGTWVYDAHLDYGNTPGSRRILWNTTAIYQLPVGRDKQFGSNMPRILDAVIGGWQLSNIFTWQTGGYYSPTFPGGSIDPSGTGSGLSSSAAGWIPTGTAQHPDRVQDVSWKPAHQNRSNWLNAAAFACPGWSSWQPGEACNTGDGYNADGTPRSTYGPATPIGRFGNSKVGTVVGPGYVDLNAGLSKVFAVVHGVTIRAEGTFTNVLNHTNLDGSSLNTNLSSSSFGVITSGIAARSGQVSMRAEF